MKIAGLILISMFAVNAFAARQVISCSEVTRSKDKHEIKAAFDPGVSLDEVWKKGKNGDEIIGYTLGKEDSRGETTARVTLTLNTGADYKFNGYYEVNRAEKAGSGYSSTFGGKAYRSIHGYDRDHSMDMMFYYPESILGQNANDFKALVTYQPAYVDQGYYNVDMICDSKLK